MYVRMYIFIYNVYHIALSSFPDMTSCYDKGDRHYTQEDAKEVVQYAKSRGIRIIPEIDIP